MNYWDTLTDRLTRTITLEGWRVVRGKHARLAGSCDYDKRTIFLYEADPKERFLVLCHEEGHRQAFLSCRHKLHTTTDAGFTEVCNMREFREMQATVYGWEVLRERTNRVSMPAWMEFSYDTAALSVAYGGKR